VKALPSQLQTLQTTPVPESFLSKAVWRFLSFLHATNFQDFFELAGESN
jgi:hypothetical protein